MARVLCISSQTVFGPVGNSAAVPALQALGHEVMQIPTVLLSNHPGLGRPAGHSTSATLMADMFQALASIGAFNDLAAIMTGYFSSAAQVIAAAKQIKALQQQHEHLQVLVDPVLGDHGKLYVAADVAEAIRDRLIPLATIATPNLFELEWLTGGNHYATAVVKLKVAEVIVTSIPTAEGLATHLYAGGKVTIQSTPQLSNVPNGTGDFLAGCYLGERLNREATPAFEHAMLKLHQVIARSAGSTTLKLTPL
jgi:pyridoxine kinase